jgi:hypothetical protein
MRKRRDVPIAREAPRRDADLDLFGPPPQPELAPQPMYGGGPAAMYEELGDVFPGASPTSAVSVSTVTQTAKDILEGAFMPLWVRGEVIDFKAHRNGHWYFCLKDQTTQLRCVVWSRDRRSIPAPPDDGMQVTVLGQLTVYATRGDMQFAVRRIEAEGDGLWRKALERTRAKLEADGLLARERKRALPRCTISWPSSGDARRTFDWSSFRRRCRETPHRRSCVSLSIRWRAGMAPTR